MFVLTEGPLAADPNATAPKSHVVRPRDQMLKVPSNRWLKTARPNEGWKPPNAKSGAGLFWVATGNTRTSNVVFWRIEESLRREADRTRMRLG